MKIDSTIGIMCNYFLYNRNTGLFTRKINKQNIIVGSFGSDGYLYVKFKNRFIPCHKLAYYFCNVWLEEIPEIFHINGITTDNRIQNLTEDANKVLKDF